MVSPSNVWDPPCIVPRAASSVLFAGFSTHSRLMDSAACVLLVVPVLGDVSFRGRCSGCRTAKYHACSQQHTRQHE